MRLCTAMFFLLFAGSFYEAARAGEALAQYLIAARMPQETLTSSPTCLRLKYLDREGLAQYVGWDGSTYSTTVFGMMD